MTEPGEPAANEARETAQVIRMADYHPKKKPLTYPRFRKAEDTERPPFPGGIDDMPV
jgi:hypothetical protein